MKAPKAWRIFGEQIHQDFTIDYPDLFSGFYEISKALPPCDRKEVIDYLKFLTGSEITKKEKMQRWLESGSNLFVVQNRISSFLEEVLSAVTGQDVSAND